MEENAILRTYHHTDERISDVLSEIDSRVLIKKAEKLNIPTPDYFDQSLWQESHHTQKYLTQEEFINLRDAIRKEQKIRAELMSLRITPIVSLISVLIGLVGVIIAYIALKK